ncbi:hypothetical protein Sru01_45260 [Sphaerisporangium rufum]|uniref:Uncharacterized protein n=1 Tax=Sphaerisporangium rufum TaxID=1381558 RepID=A0A919V1A7_9ACTN|nr:hypothetical protein [Sphaerisporangium rufum]GII79544.1 hypothetical protein Sru01_45260 [Sphaerisporangium rufum]
MTKRIQIATRFTIMAIFAVGGIVLGTTAQADSAPATAIRVSAGSAATMYGNTPWG